MFRKFNFPLGFLALCVYLVHVSEADPLINQRDKECLAKWRQDEKYNISSAIIKMNSHIQLNGTVGWQHLSYLQKYPKYFDVAFVVGPKKIIVRALRLNLVTASAVFEREIERDFEYLAGDIGEGIPMRDLDPAAFKLFVELTILNNWSEEALMALELPSNQLLHLMSICRKYEMAIALENFQLLANKFLRDFETHVKPEDFLLLSQPQLEKILASDKLHMTETDVYRYACSWAEEQCKKQGLEVTGVNQRLVLGNCLYKIRFPVMSITEFVTLPKVKEILSIEEIIEISIFITTGEKFRKSNGSTELKFKSEKRKEYSFTSVPTGSSTVSVKHAFPIVNSPFVCDGKLKGGQEFNMNMTINLRGVGFLGPIDADSIYSVSVQIHKRTKGWDDVTSKIEKRIFAKKAQTFYFIFDQPIILNPIPYDGWRNFYYIVFSLQGPNTPSFQHTLDTKRIYDGNKEFVIKWRAPQLVEIVYDTL